MAEKKDRGLQAWINFLSRHWGMALVIIGVIAAAAIVSFLVFLWFVADAQTTALVPASLGLWTVGFFFTFVLNLIFWELLFVGSWGIPVAIFLWAGWYRKLPAEERKEYEGGPRAAGGGGGFSFFVWVVWLIVVWTDGAWERAFAHWTFDQWVYSWVVACLWVLLLAGIPGLIFLLWSMNKARSRPAATEATTPPA
jgi:hypothetical protein